ncbi:MAG: hypothetical protein DMG50_28660, partial [Acidobacteria bacterium]
AALLHRHRNRPTGKALTHLRDPGLNGLRNMADRPPTGRSPIPGHITDTPLLVLLGGEAAEAREHLRRGMANCGFFARLAPLSAAGVPRS